MRVLEDALGFLKVIETPEGKFVKVATIHPIGDPNDTNLRKVVLGSQPYEKLFFIYRKQGEPIVIPRDKLAEFYMNYRNQLIVELSEIKGGFIVEVWSPLNRLLEFLETIRDTNFSF